MKRYVKSYVIIICKSLPKDKDKYSENLVALMAGRVEEAIFKLHGRRTDVKYKNKIRSRHANLKDARNPDLRNSVMEGMITPEGNNLFVRLLWLANLF